MDVGGGGQILLGPVVPCLTARLVTELGGRIEMGFQHEAVAASLVGGKLLEIIHGIVNPCAQTLDNQRAVGIAAARGAHGIDKSLMVAQQGLLVGLHLRRCGTGLDGMQAWLIHAGKEQVLVEVAQVGGYLLPIGLEFRDEERDVLLAQIGEAVLLYPSAVLVHVQNDIEVVVDAVLHYLLDALQPGLVNLGQVLIGQSVAIPAAGDADGFEAQRLDIVNQLLGDHGTAGPRLLALELERIAEVPTAEHLLGNLGRCLAHTRGVGSDGVGVVGRYLAVFYLAGLRGSGEVIDVVNKDVDFGLSKAENAFFKGNYKNSLEQAISAINIVEPGIHRKLLAEYEN